MMDGFLNVLKPPGLSSGTVVAIVKRVTGEKAGHAGTLDPEACGILPVMVGKATRLFDFMVEKQKTYLAEIAFGRPVILASPGTSGLPLVPMLLVMA